MVTPTPQTPIAAVVVAAGSGSRFGGDLPKQFLPLAGKPVVCHCLDTLRTVFPQLDVVLVLSDSGKEIWEELCARTGYSSPEVVLGGATRSESVLNGLRTLRRRGVPGNAVVLVHDGARPFPAPDLLRSLVEALEGGAGAAAPAVALTDSVLAFGDGLGVEVVPRDSLRAVQTPQAFRLDEIIHAHANHDNAKHGAPTDECAAYIHAFGRPVTLVAGSPDNIKITNPRDLAIAEIICAAI